MGAIFRMALYLYGAGLLSAGVIKKKKYKFFIIPLGIIAFIICALPQFTSSFFLNKISESFEYAWIIAAVVFMLPVALYIFSIIRKKHINKIKRELEANVDERIEEYGAEAHEEKARGTENTDAS
jgi:membrane-bound ClpP family serine protease